MSGADSALVELRVLDGPNLYFPRAAIKVTLDLGTLLALEEPAALRLGERIGLQNARVGAPGSGFRQRFAARAVAGLVREVAAEAGTKRLAIRSRPSANGSTLVVAYPWTRLERARALALAVSGVLAGLSSADVDALVGLAGEQVRASPLGDRPPTILPRIPVVAVTGTNGKTTTARLIAHIGMANGWHVGWSSTDGIYLDGELVEAGDYSGPSGAGRVLAHEQVQLAVTETARGGILLRGIGITHNSVSVVTNVSADHLGQYGIDSLDQLAEVKAVVPRSTLRTGWCVLNAHDPRVMAMRAVTKAPTWVFSRDADSPGVREVLSGGGRATALIDGWVSVLRPGADPAPVVPIVDVPVTLAGLSHHNVENALAAASAALAVGIPSATVAEGLRAFSPGPEHNPGRMNVYSLGLVTVVLDLAHNEAGLEALVEIMTGLRAPGGRLLLALGTAGDRTDDIVMALAEQGARHTDLMVVVHKDRYLRGRDMDSFTETYRAGARTVGVTDVAAYPSELGGLQALCAEADDGDVVAVMTHQDRPALESWLRERGATVDDPQRLREKVTLAQSSRSGDGIEPRR